MSGFSVGAWHARVAAFSLRRRMRLYEKLGRFTQNSMPIQSAIRNIQRRYAKYKDVRAGLFLSMLTRIEEGDEVSKVLGAYIPVGERLLIQSGEESGKIYKGFFEAKNLAESIARLKSALKQELIAPLMLLLVLGVMLTVVSFQLVPVLETAVPLAKWPSFSKGLYTISHGTATLGPFIVIGIALIIFVSIRSLPRWRGPVRENLDKWCPPYSIYREIQGSSFLIALASLTSAGKSVGFAVERLGMHGSPWLNVHLKRMLRTLVAGGNPGEAIRTGLFDREIEDDIEDFSRTSNFEDALAKVGQDQTNDAIERITKRAAVLRNLLLFVVLGLLLYIYAAAVMIGVSVAQQGMNMVH